MARPSFATQVGVRIGNQSYRSGTQSQCDSNSKPSLDRCRCCSGDSTPAYFNDYFNITDPSAIRLY